MTLSSADAAIARTHDHPARIGKTKKLLSSLFSFIGDHQIIGEVAGEGKKKKKKKTVRSDSDGKQVVVANHIVVLRPAVPDPSWRHRQGYKVVPLPTTTFFHR
jgi:hypothetical protein